LIMRSFGNRAGKVDSIISGFYVVLDSNICQRWYHLYVVQ